MPDVTIQNVYSEAVTPQANVPPTPMGAVPPPPKGSFPRWIAFAVVGLAVLFFIIIIARALLSQGVLGKQEITWWGLWEDDSIITPLIAEYEQANPNIKIKYVKNSKEDYRERLTNALAKGTGPDIFRFHNSWVPMFKKELDPLPASVMSAADFAKTFYPVAASDLTNGTSLVGIPLEYDGLALYINQDIFSASGKTPPATWDDLRTTACQLTTVTNDTISQAGAALGTTTNVDHWPEILGLMMLQNGVNLEKPTGKPAEDALTFFTIFSSDSACSGVGGSSGKVWDKTLPPSTVAFTAGKLAMYIGPSWRAFEIQQQNPSLKFKTVPLPQLPKANPSERNVNYASYWAEGVWKRSKNKKAAWDFLKFLSTKESLEKLYANAAKLRPFGEPYPRVDMANLLASDPIVGSIISGAPDSESWYLQSRTFDGPTGINSQIDKYFEDAINAVGSGTTADRALEPVAAGVAQVLSRYGFVSK